MTATTTTTPALVPSENILSAKTDLSISNAIVKAGLGFGGGVLASAILFRRRPWPVLMGLGFGLGQGYSDAERIFNPAAVPGFVIAPAAGAAPAAASPYSGFNPFSSAGSDLVTKGSELVRSAKEAAGLAETKVEEAAEKVVEKVETKLEEKKKPQRWV